MQLRNFRLLLILFAIDLFLDTMIEKKYHTFYNFAAEKKGKLEFFLKENDNFDVRKASTQESKKIHYNERNY